MSNASQAGTFSLGERTVNRMGYGAMQLAGPHVFGPPRDGAAALAWLLQRAPNILLIPGTSSVAHLHENLSASELVIPPALLAELDALA